MSSKKSIFKVKKVTDLTKKEKKAYDEKQDAWESGAEDRAWQQVREKRDRLLLVNDPYFSSGHPLNNPDVDAYRQALLDLPQTYDKPEDVVWPENPLEG